MAFRVRRHIDYSQAQSYPKVERKDYTVKEPGWDRIGGISLREHIDYMPQKGLQEQACACDCNVIFCCGESQIGKSFLTFLSAVDGVGCPNYTGRIISFRQLDSAKGSSILRDAISVLGGFAGCEISTSQYPTFYWPQWNNSVQLIHSNFNVANPSEWEEFQDYAKKNQASFLGFDEITQMKHFKMFSYWLSRNRDDSGRTPKVLATFNHVHGHFTNTMLKDGGYFDDNWYIRPEMVGVVRYFYVEGEDEHSIVWADTVEELTERCNLEAKISPKERKLGVTPRELVKSFTMFTGETADNQKLLYATKGQNIGNLHNTGGTQRAILKSGYGGPIEKTEINVNRQMILNLWDNPISNDENMYASFDVGGGKGDSAPMIIWKGLQMIAIEYFKGEPQDLSAWVRSKLDAYNVPIQHFAYDGTGFGYWVQGLTNGIAVTANKRPLKEYDEYGNEIQRDEFFNCRSQLFGKLEVALKRGDISCVIPKDKLVQFGAKDDKRRFIDILFDGMALFSIRKRNGKTYYNSKEEFKARYHYSPGELDAMSLRMVFELDTRERKQPKPQVEDDAYDEIFTPHPLSGWGNSYWNY